MSLAALLRTNYEQPIVEQKVQQLVLANVWTVAKKQ